MFSDVEYNPYQSWYIIIILSIVSMNQCSTWFTFACIDPDVVHAFFPSFSADIIRWTLFAGQVGNYVGLPITMYNILSAGGLRLSLIIGCTVTMLVNAVLCVLVQTPVRDNLDGTVLIWIVFVVLCMNGCLTPIVCALPAAFAAERFPPHQRGLPTGTAILANALGFIVWFPLGPALAPNAEGVPYLMYVRFGMSALAAIPIFLYYPKAPTKFPQCSRSPAERNSEHNDIPSSRLINMEANMVPPPSESKLAELKEKLFPQKNAAPFLALVIGMGLQNGLVNSFFNFTQILLHKKYSPTFLGWIGFSATVATIPGGLLGGRWCDVPFIRRYLHIFNVSTLSLQLALLITLGALLGFMKQSPWIPDFPAWLLIIVVVSIEFLSGVATAVLTMRAVRLVQGSMPETMAGLWVNFWIGLGYMSMFAIPNEVLVHYGTLMEVAFLGLVVVALILCGPGK
eukprot:PhF_6_TR12314/c0_g1_i2/m.19562